MNFIKIPNDFVQEYIYNNETVYVYGLIQKMITLRGKIILNLLWLYNELNINSNNKRMKDKIKNGLIQLKNDNYIDFDINCLENVNKIMFININNINNYYVKIKDYEFDKIHNYKNANVYKLFITFANLKSRCGNNGQCFPSFEQIKKDTGIKSDKTLTNYLHILRDELKLILYDNPGMGVLKNKNGKYVVKQLNNIYTMNYEGYDQMLKETIKYRKNKLDRYYDKIKKDNSVNKRRSESMIKYHAEKSK